MSACVSASSVYARAELRSRDEFARNQGAEVVAVCDIDDANFAKTVEAVEKDGGKAPRTEKDFRRLLDDKSIDAIVDATPDHWHALITVIALPGRQGCL